MNPVITKTLKPYLPEMPGRYKRVTGQKAWQPHHEHRHQWKKKGVKPVFGGKSSAISLGCDPTCGAKSKNFGGKNYIFTPIFFGLEL